jgi:hypothetical protein
MPRRFLKLTGLLVALTSLSAVTLAACGGTSAVVGDADGGDGGNADGGDGGNADGGSAPGSGNIVCGSASCTAVTQECCFAAGGASSCVAAGSCKGTAVACATPQNCSTGEVCCANADLSVSCAPTCAKGTLMCGTNADCPAGNTCVPSLNGYSVCAKLPTGPGDGGGPPPWLDGGSLPPSVDGGGFPPFPDAWPGD